MMHQRAIFRGWAKWGAQHGPLFLLRLGPVLLGVLFALMLRSSLRQVTHNLRRVHGRRGRWVEFRDAVETFVRFAQCFTEGLAQGRSDCRAEVEVLAPENFDEFTRDLGGAIILTAHLGPWDGAARDLRRRFARPIVLVMEQEGDPASAEVEDMARHAEGVSVLRLGDDPLLALPLLEHLKAGGVAAIQLDRAPDARPATLAELFGEEFPVPAGPFLLAGLAKVPLIPVFTERTGFFRRRVTVGTPRWVGRRPDAALVQATARLVLAELEVKIRSNPTQWFHFVPAEAQRRRVESLFRVESNTSSRARVREAGASCSHLAKGPP